VEELFWNKEDRKGKRIAHLGVSLFDINTPNESLLGGHSSLISTFVIEAGSQVYEDKLISIYPELLYTYSASTSALNIGAVTHYSLDHLNIRTVASAVELHTKYLLKEGVMFGLQLVNEGYSIGMSYDLPLHNSVAHQGAFEIGAKLSKLIKSRYRKTNRRKKKAGKKKTTKRKASPKKKSYKKSESKNKREQESGKEHLVDNDSKEMEIPVETKSVKDKEESEREEANATTTVGDLRHEPLLLEPTKLIYYFDFDSSDTEQDTKDYIADLVKILNEDDYIQIKIVGHTDNIGTEAYNLILSRKRAQIIKDQLTRNSISTKRITTGGKGESEPLSDNTTAEKRSKNRRVEVTLFY